MTSRKKTGPRRVGRSTGVHIDRKPKMLYYVDGVGEVREKAPRQKGPGRSTGKHVDRAAHKGMIYVDKAGEVRVLEREGGGGGRRGPR